MSSSFVTGGLSRRIPLLLATRLPSTCAATTCASFSLLPVHSTFQRTLSSLVSSSFSSCVYGSDCTASSLFARTRLSLIVRVSGFSSASSESAASSSTNESDSKKQNEVADPMSYIKPNNFFDRFPFNDPIWKQFFSGDTSGANTFYTPDLMSGPRYFQRRIEGPSRSERRQIEETIENLTRVTNVFVTSFSEKTSFLLKFLELRYAWIHVAINTDIYEPRVEDPIFQVSRVISGLMTLKRPHFDSNGEEGKLAERELRATIDLHMIQYWCNKGDVTENISLIEQGEKILENLLVTCKNELIVLHFSPIIQAYLSLHTILGKEEYFHRAQKRISQVQSLFPDRCQLPNKNIDHGWFYIESAIVQNYLDQGNKKELIQQRLEKMDERWRKGFEEMIEHYEEDVLEEKIALEQRKEIQTKYPPTKQAP